MEQEIVEPVEAVGLVELELKPLIIESKEEQIQEKLFTLFYPANGNLGRRNEKLSRQIADLIKKNPDLIWVMINELEKYQNAEGGQVKNAHDRIKDIFQELQKNSFLKGVRFRRLTETMKNWPNHDNLDWLKSIAPAFYPNPHAKAWEGIVSFKKQDNPWAYHL